MQTRVVILGAGFGGLELATTLSEALGDDIAVTLIDKSDAFVFGFAKLDVMFGRTTPDAVRMPYSEIAKAGVRFLQETITAIDPDTRRVTTDADTYEADVLVIALGADYDMDATPGLAEGANEFYSVAGANTLRDVLPAFAGGRVVVGVCGAPFKCPPAPSECALLLHDYFLARGIREDCDLKLVMPLGTPVPPSPDTSQAILGAFAERGIEFVGGRRVSSIDHVFGTRPRIGLLTKRTSSLPSAWTRKCSRSWASLAPGLGSRLLESMIPFLSKMAIWNAKSGRNCVVFAHSDTSKPCGSPAQESRTWSSVWSAARIDLMICCSKERARLEPVRSAACSVRACSSEVI